MDNNSSTITSKIQILYPAQTAADDGNGAKVTPTLYRDLWAHRSDPRSTVTQIEGAGAGIIITQNFTVRAFEATKAVKRGWQIVCSGKTYVIDFVDDTVSGWLTYICRSNEP